MPKDVSRGVYLKRALVMMSGMGALFEIDDHADAVAVGLIAQER